MEQYKFKIAAAACCIVVFFALLGVMGDYDYCERIVLQMTQEEYDSVKSLLTQENGTEPSEREIAHWWADHCRE